MILFPGVAVDKTIDLTNDPFASVAFSEEQRHIWKTLRSEIIIARERVQELEERIRVLNHYSHTEIGIQTILTRPEFNREVARMLAFDERYGGISSVLYYDIENLSDIIKVNGQVAGNTVVRVLCDTLAREIRISDILGRLDVDEFGVLLLRCDNAKAWQKGEKLAASLHEALGQIKDCRTEPIVSYGAYTFKEKENLAIGLKHAAKSMTRLIGKLNV